MDISVQLTNPPEKVYTSKGGSKYDEAIKTAINHKGEWLRGGAVPIVKRHSIYSTASAIKNGRLGNIPQGESITVICRRVDDEVVMFMKSL